MTIGSSLTRGPKRAPVLRILRFLAAAAAGTLAVGPAVGLIGGLLGLQPGHPASDWLFPAFVSVAYLAITWAALRADGVGFRALGLVATRRRAAEFGVGLAAAAVLFAAVAFVHATAVGAEWAFDPATGARASLLALPVALARALPEELLFRGYAFRQARAAWGGRAALAASALAFGAYHVVGSGHWGAGAAFAFALPALGGLVFGGAAVRTGGLALPLGLHVGGNWASVGVVVLAAPPGAALWAAPLDAAQFAALTAPDLLPHLPYLVAVALLAAAVRAWPRRARRAAA